MANNTDDLKLVYILKIGSNSKGKGVYEFLFSENPYEIDFENLNWDKLPASQYKEDTIPDEDVVDLTCSLVTDEFSLICLHDSDYFSYLHGYNSIIALAYEDDMGDAMEEDEYVPFSDFNDQFEEDKDDQPLLVFHYGEEFKSVKDKLYNRDILLKHDQLEYK